MNRLLTERSSGYPFARSSACAFVFVSGSFSGSSVCPVFLAVYGYKHVIND